MKRHCAIRSTDRGNACIFCRSHRGRDGATESLLIPHEGGVTLFGSSLFISQLALCGGMGVSAGSSFGLLALLLFQGFHITLLHLNTAQYADHVALESFQHLGEQSKDSRLYSCLGFFWA